MSGSPCKKVTSVRIQARFMGFSPSQVSTCKRTDMSMWFQIVVVWSDQNLIRSQSPLLHCLRAVACGCAHSYLYSVFLRDSCNKSNRSCYSVSIANILTISYVPWSTLFPEYWFASAYLLFHKKTKLSWKANVQQTRRLWSGKWMNYIVFFF